MNEANLLVRWAGQSCWHFVQSFNHGTTACNVRIPLNEVAPEYADIEIHEITNFKGICTKCFHQMCIDTQNSAMWDIYYAYIAKPR